MSTSILTDQTLTPGYTANTLAAQTSIVSLGWTGLTMELTATSGDIPPTWGRQIAVAYAFSSTDIDPTTAQEQLAENGRMYLVLPPTADTTTTIISPAIIATGDYLYTWIAVPDLIGSDVVINLSITESSVGGSPAQVLAGNYAGTTPNFTPTTSVAQAFDTSNGQPWAWYNGSWH